MREILVTSKATKDERSYKRQQTLIQLIDKAASGQANKESFPVMNAKKFDSKFNGLTSLAKKVYEAMPINEGWNVSQILAEIARNGGTCPDHKTTLRICQELAESGMAIVTLTKGRGDGFFKRVHIPKTQPPQQEPVMAEPTPAPKAKPADILTLKPAPKKKGPMELLADLASKARQFAEELDNAALEIEQEFQNSEAKSEQLKQLKSLLKGITD